MTSSSGRRDPRVDGYIDALPDWQRAICREVRELVHAADPEVEETIKRSVQPYFVLKGNICALLAARDHVNVFLYDGGIVPDPEEIITGGHGNKTARMISIHEEDEINARALKAIFEQIIANNRAGGWRRLKESHRPEREWNAVPKEVAVSASTTTPMMAPMRPTATQAPTPVAPR